MKSCGLLSKEVDPKESHEEEDGVWENGEDAEGREGEGKVSSSWTFLPSPSPCHLPVSSLVIDFDKDMGLTSVRT